MDTSWTSKPSIWMKLYVLCWLFCVPSGWQFSSIHLAECLGLEVQRKEKRKRGGAFSYISVVVQVNLIKEFFFNRKQGGSLCTEILFSIIREITLRRESRVLDYFVLQRGNYLKRDRLLNFSIMVAAMIIYVVLFLCSQYSPIEASPSVQL